MRVVARLVVLLDAVWAFLLAPVWVILHAPEVLASQLRLLGRERGSD